MIEGPDHRVDDKSRAPVRMRESRMTSAQLSFRKGEHDDENDPCLFLTNLKWISIYTIAII